MVSVPATVPGSLSEGAAERSEAEGVSSDGSTGPMIYPQAIIGSEFFELLRSSKYTPSVSLSLDSSLREGAGVGRSHSSGYSLKSQVSGDFHRPYEGSECFTFHHSSCRPKTARLRAIFIAPTKLKEFDILPLIVLHSLSQPFGLPAPSEREPGWVRTIQPAARKPGGCGRFSSPLRKNVLPFIGGKVLPKNLDKGGGKG